jgi:hypothetical protein
MRTTERSPWEAGIAPSVVPSSLRKSAKKRGKEGP